MFDVFIVKPGNILMFITDYIEITGALITFPIIILCLY